MSLIKRIAYEVLIVLIIIAAFYAARMFDNKGEGQSDISANNEVVETAIEPATTILEVPSEVTLVVPVTSRVEVQNSKTKLVVGNIDFNQAEASEIERLKGIGPVIAKRIVDYRMENGDFSSSEDLLKVKGIGPKTLLKIMKGEFDKSP